MSNSKACNKCKQIQDLSQFHRDRKKSDGLTIDCKTCRNQRSKEYRQANPEKLKARNDRYKRLYPERVRAHQNSWRERNREHYNKLSRERARGKPRKEYVRNPEKAKQYRDNYKKNNPGYDRKHNQLRKMRLRSITSYEITSREIEALLRKPCAYCGHIGEITLDHVIPISRGGNHGIGNLLPACRICNSSKRERFITEWKKAKSA